MIETMRPLECRAAFAGRGSAGAPLAGPEPTGASGRVPIASSGSAGVCRDPAAGLQGVVLQQVSDTRNCVDGVSPHPGMTNSHRRAGKAGCCGGKTGLERDETGLPADSHLVRGAGRNPARQALLAFNRFYINDLREFTRCSAGVSQREEQCDEFIYKVAKVFLEIEDFHSRSERGVKQELFARFGLIAMTRLFADRAERGAAFRARPGEHGKPGLQANFKHALSVVGQALEGLFAQQAATLARAAGEIANAIARCRQRRRPRRSYPRRSLKPAPKWRPSKKAAAATAA